MNIKCSICLDEYIIHDFFNHLSNHIYGTSVSKKNLKLKCLQDRALNCFNKDFKYSNFKKHLSNVHNIEITVETNNDNVETVEESMIIDDNLTIVSEEEEVAYSEYYNDFGEDDVDTESYISPEVMSFIEEIFSCSSQHKIVDQSINNCIKLLKSIYDAENTKDKLKKCIESLTKVNTYSKRSKMITTKSDKIIKKEIHTTKGIYPCYFFSILSRIKLLLKNNDFKNHLKFDNEIKKNVYDSYVCGEYIQGIKSDVVKKYNISDPKILFIVTYTDDYNVTSRSSILNSDSASVSVGYFYFLNMNESVSSHLETIFQFYVGPSCISKYSYDDEPFITIKECIEEIKDSVINISGEKYFVRHVLHSGDNLELKKFHNIESGFRGRDAQPCRLCKVTGSQFGLITRESLIPIQSIRVSDQSYFVDITHDFYLGVAIYFFKIIFPKLNNRRLVSLETVNNAIKNINFQDHDRPNFFKDLNNIYQNSGQMKSLISFFPVILKRSLINEAESTDFIKTLLKSYENMRKIMEIIDSPIVYEFDLISLEKFIEIHIKFLRDERRDDEDSRRMIIKFKEHMLIHYISAIKKLGNLKKYCTIRCEAAHQQGKRMIQISNNKKDICLTLARKQQLNFGYLVGKEKYFNIKQEKLKPNDHILLPNKKYKPAQRNMPTEPKYFCCRITDVLENEIIVHKLNFIVKVGSLYVFEDSNEYLTIQKIDSWDLRNQSVFHFMENFSFFIFYENWKFPITANYNTRNILKYFNYE